MTDDRPPRPASVGKMLLVATAFGLVAGAILGTAQSVVSLSPWVQAGGLLVAVGVGMALFVPAWGRVDEAVRAAHEWAWFWGGSSGIAAAFVISPFILSGDLDLSAGGDPAAAAINALYGYLLLQVLGYGVAWAIWWLRRR